MTNYRTVREGRKLTAQQAATALGVSITTLFNWELEKTQPSADAIKKMVSLYDCTADELLGLPEKAEV